MKQTLKQFFLCDEVLIFFGALHPLKCYLIHFCAIDKTKLWKLSIYYFWTLQRPNSWFIRTLLRMIKNGWLWTDVNFWVTWQPLNHEPYQKMERLGCWRFKRDKVCVCAREMERQNIKNIKKKENQRDWYSMSQVVKTVANQPRVNGRTHETRCQLWCCDDI